jgi:NTE family protein
LGAEKLLVIGVRRMGATAYEARADRAIAAPSVARVVNTILNGALLDAIEQDVERLRRLNEHAKILTPEQHQKSGIKPIEYLLISPSADIGEMAVQQAHKLPRVLRYLLKGLGSLEDASEIISYLLFDPGFCSDLIEIGYRDGLRNKDQLLPLLGTPYLSASP